MIDDSTIRIAAHLLDARDLAKRLYGDGYEVRLRPFREAIQRWHGESGDPLAGVCKVLLEQSESHGEATILLAMAACCEEMGKERGA